jgi:type VI secretion system protein ImpL
VVSFDGIEADYPMIQSAIARVYASFNVIVGAPDVSKAAFDEVAKRAEEGSDSNIVRLSTLAAQQPEPLRRILNAIAAQSWSVLVKESRNYIDQRWEAEVLPLCQQAIMTRYPAKADSDDNIAINDFTNFFAPGGIIDKFFKTHLEAYVDTSGQTWVLRKLDGMSLGISSAGLKVFEQAHNIRQAYFGANNPAPKMNFTLTPSFLDAKAAKVVVQENKKIDAYQHEPPREFGFSWPSEEPAVDLSVTLFDLQNASSSYRASGPWAWFRLFEDNELKKNASGDRYSLGFKLRGLEARYDLKIDGMNNPLSQPALTGFACPALL